MSFTAEGHIFRPAVWLLFFPPPQEGDAQLCSPPPLALLALIHSVKDIASQHAELLRRDELARAAAGSTAAAAAAAARASPSAHAPASSTPAAAPEGCWGRPPLPAATPTPTPSPSRGVLGDAGSPPSSRGEEAVTAAGGGGAARAASQFSKRQAGGGAVLASAVAAEATPGAAAPPSGSAGAVANGAAKGAVRGSVDSLTEAADPALAPAPTPAPTPEPAAPPDSGGGSPIRRGLVPVSTTAAATDGSPGTAGGPFEAARGAAEALLGPWDFSATQGTGWPPPPEVAAALEGEDAMLRWSLAQSFEMGRRWEEASQLRSKVRRLQAALDAAQQRHRGSALGLAGRADASARATAPGAAHVGGAGGGSRPAVAAAPGPLMRATGGKRGRALVWGASGGGGRDEEQLQQHVGGAVEGPGPSPARCGEAAVATEGASGAQKRAEPVADGGGGGGAGCTSSRRPVKRPRHTAASSTEAVGDEGGRTSSFLH